MRVPSRGPAGVRRGLRPVARGTSRARRHAGPIDLLLTDVVMPGRSGPALARDFHHSHPTTRILFMSGHASDVRRERMAGLAGCPFLPKPFTARDLARRLDEILARPAGD